MDDLKVGDIVTVRSSPNALGIRGCKIIQFYEVLDDDNKLVAGALVNAGQFGELCFKRESLHKE